jgi:head-tail adaptor
MSTGLADRWAHKLAPRAAMVACCRQMAESIYETVRATRMAWIDHTFHADQNKAAARVKLLDRTTFFQKHFTVTSLPEDAQKTWAEAAKTWAEAAARPDSQEFKLAKIEQLKSLLLYRYLPRLCRRA